MHRVASCRDPGGLVARRPPERHAGDRCSEDLHGPRSTCTTHWSLAAILDARVDAGVDRVEGQAVGGRGAEGADGAEGAEGLACDQGQDVGVEGAGDEAGGEEGTSVLTGRAAW